MEKEKKCIRCDHCTSVLREWSVDCRCTYHDYDVESKHYCEHFTTEGQKEQSIVNNITNRNW